jgi:cellulose synthase/poly-beta-1,6-N-acetylglucosamine synthase-like glycosyltransferase
MSCELNNEPFISIIVPAYNEEKRISRCLTSINKLNYTENNFEVIVVDDGSHDSTSDIARVYGANIIKQQHFGCAEARNTGVEHARGDVIAFIDADDICKEDWLITAVPYLKDSNVGAVGCYHDLFNREKRFVLVSYYEKRFRHTESPASTGHLGASGLVIKKCVFIDVGGFNPKLLAAEDAELSYKIRAKGYNLLLLNKPLITVTYPDGILGYISTQIRNSSFLVYSSSINLKVSSGNKYSGLRDYVQSIFPTILILAIAAGMYPIIHIILTYILLLIFININFLRYITKYRVELGASWPILSVFYLLIRSMAWNIGLFYGIRRIVKQ